MSRDDITPVVFLSHDDGEGHGRVLGRSVIDFVDRWSLLGCVGPEEWQMTPFLRPDQPYLDADGDNARLWREWFGLPTRELAPSSSLDSLPTSEVGSRSP